MANNALEFSQKQLAESYEQAEFERNRFGKESNRRLAIAYVLKSIAVLGGIAITAGVDGIAAQGIGIAISIAVAADRISENHLRLLSVRGAANAYRRSLAAARRKHTESLGKMLPLQGTDPNRFGDEKAALDLETVTQVNSDRDIITTAVEEADIKLLRSLASDEKSGSHPGSDAKPG